MLPAALYLSTVMGTQNAKTELFSYQVNLAKRVRDEVAQHYNYNFLPTKVSREANRSST